MQKLSPRINTIAFRPNRDGPPLLLLAGDHIELNMPDGSPLIEASADGSIRVRGEAIEGANPEIYERFVEWIRACCQAPIVQRDVKPENMPEYGPSPLAKVVPLLHAQSIIGRAYQEWCDAKREQELETSVPVHER